MKDFSIYKYTNYRKLLKSLYRYYKKKTPHFSYRYFSDRAGFTSPNFLKLVIDGQRNLTKKSILKVATGFKFNKDELEFFENLVFMNQSDSSEEKKHYFFKITKTRGYVKIRKLEKEKFKYFSEWYHPAVREILVFYGGGLTPRQIGNKLFPKVSAGKIEKSLKLLKKLGLVKKDENGKWHQTSPNLTTGDEVNSIMVADYHKNMIGKSIEAMDHFSPSLRDISSITISAKKSTIPVIKKLLSSFRKNLLELSGEIDDPDEVLQVNFQLYPLTDIKE